jgi:parallel beta-helix repeat protein
MKEHTMFSLRTISSPRLLLAAVVLTMLFLPVAPASAAGTTLYVDGSNSACSDTGSGTAAQPFCTIKAAATKVSPGATVQVAGGTYTQNVGISISGTSSDPITFTAAPGATVIVSDTSGVGISLSSVNWVSLTGFTVTRSTDYGINVTNSSHITLAGNHVSYAGQPVSGQNRTGIRLSNVSNSLVSGNTSDHNSDYGIAVVAGSTGNELRANVTYNNSRVFERATAGIRLYQSPGNVVDGNISHDNQDSGIECYPGSNNTLLFNNVVYNNGDHGIDDLMTTGQRIIANTAYHNVTAGINVEGSSTGATIADNISVDNGIKSPRTHSDIRVEHGSTDGTTMDSDLVYLTVPDTLLIWDSVSYSSLAAFQSATGQESHGIQADPRWANPSAGDFHLTASSPAIDSADSGVSGFPATDVEGNARFDDLGVANTGLGSVPYADRGAFEYQSSAPGDNPPTAALSATPTSGPAPLQVTADASGSTDGDATPIATYTFDFGDGSTAVGPQAGATAAHTYTAAGTYTINVTVTDTAGLSSTATAQVTVAAGGPTNLVGNPGFETGLTGWNTSGSDPGISLTRVSGAHSGSWAARLTNTSTVAATYVLNDSPNWVTTTTSGTYTGSMWVRSDTPGAVLKLRFREYAGSTLVGTATSSITLTSSWQQVTLTYVPVSPGSSALDFNAYVSKGAAGTSFDADDAVISVG